MRKILFIIVSLVSLNFNAQTDIKVMFYNLLHYPSAPPVTRANILKDILNTYEPDLFLVCELESQVGANSILNTSLSDINKTYFMAQYITNQSSGSSFLAQLAYFNADYFILNNQTIYTTDYRDINHYTFIIKTADYQTNPILLEVFVTHLKANQGSTNEAKRLQAIEQFSTALENLSPNSFVLFAGDFNLYSSFEPAYQKILDANNNVIIKDLQNLTQQVQVWHNNDLWQNIHTQSTRISNVEFDNEGAGGGMDDQFDFIMLSENMLSNGEVHYKPNSYDSYGSNENCFNNRIDSNDCSGTYDLALRTNLYNMSDHLPVVLKLQTNQTIGVNDEINLQNWIKFPNGNIAKEVLKLKINEQLFQKELRIYNTLGQELFSTKISNSNLMVNTIKLKEAVYFIKIEGLNQVLKFVKI